MTCQEFIEYVNRKIYPFMLNEKGRERFEGIYAQYPGSFIVEHIERWTGEHFSYDRFGQPTEQTAAELLEKIDSILYYGAHPKIGHAVKAILGGGADQYDHWDRVWAERVLWFYVKDMLRTGSSEEDILQGLKGNILRLTDRPKNMAEWMVRVGKMTEFVHNVQ